MTVIISDEKAAVWSFPWVPHMSLSYIEPATRRYIWNVSPALPLSISLEWRFWVLSSLSLAWVFLLPSEWCVQLPSCSLLSSRRINPRVPGPKGPVVCCGSSCCGPEDHEGAVKQPGHCSIAPGRREWENKVRLDLDLPCGNLRTWDVMKISGWTERATSRHRKLKGQEADPDRLALPPAALRWESSSPCSQSHCCHYRGVEVAKEGWYNKITWKNRGWGSKQQLWK